MKGNFAIPLKKQQQLDQISTSINRKLSINHWHLKLNQMRIKDKLTCHEYRFPFMSTSKSDRESKFKDLMEEIKN